MAFTVGQILAKVFLGIAAAKKSRQHLSRMRIIENRLDGHQQQTLDNGWDYGVRLKSSRAQSPGTTARCNDSQREMKVIEKSSERRSHWYSDVILGPGVVDALRSL